MFGKLSRDEVNTDVIPVIGKGARNHQTKEVVALGYDTK
jgi:hypothetical protein